MREEVDWPVNVLVEFRVIGNESHPDVVRLGREERWAAPIGCVIHWGDYASVDQLLDRLSGLLFVSQWDSPCTENLLGCSHGQ